MDQQGRGDRAPNCNVPAVTEVRPEFTLVPVRVSVPLPVLVSPPAPPSEPP